MKKMLKAKAGDIPEEQVDKMLDLIEKKPELFQTIALEIQEKMKAGVDQQAATMEVMQAHQDELRELA